MPGLGPHPTPGRATVNRRIPGPAARGPCRPEAIMHFGSAWEASRPDAEAEQIRGTSMKRYWVLCGLAILVAGCSDASSGVEKEYRGRTIRVWVQMATQGTENDRDKAVRNLQDFG